MHIRIFGLKLQTSKDSLLDRTGGICTASESNNFFPYYPNIFKNFWFQCLWNCLHHSSNSNGYKENQRFWKGLEMDLYKFNTRFRMDIVVYLVRLWQNRSWEQTTYLEINSLLTLYFLLFLKSTNFILFLNAICFLRILNTCHSHSVNLKN